MKFLALLGLITLLSSSAIITTTDSELAKTETELIRLPEKSYLTKKRNCSSD